MHNFASKTSRRKTYRDRQRFHCGRPAGFTLTELILIVVIIGIMAAIGIQSLLSYQPSYYLRRAANDLYSHMQKARVIAIQNNRSVQIVFNSQAYTIQFNDGTENLGLPRTVDLLSAYKGGVQLLPSNPYPPPSSAASSLTFNALGTGNSAYVYMSNASNSAFYQIGALTSGVILKRRWDGSQYVSY
jgi:type II secretory pathway pseudopilin PulG